MPKLNAVLLMFLVACSKATVEDKVTYENTIQSLIAKGCAECHGADSPTMEEFDRDKEKYKEKEIGPRYDTYEHLMVVVNGADLGALMRRLDDGTNHRDGKPGNMNQHLGTTPEERAANLRIFKRWVGGWTLKKKADVNDAERQAILAPRN